MVDGPYFGFRTLCKAIHKPSVAALANLAKLEKSTRTKTARRPPAICFMRRVSATLVTHGGYVPIIEREIT
jgi:hypothetical protein